MRKVAAERVQEICLCMENCEADSRGSADFEQILE